MPKLPVTSIAIMLCLIVACQSPPPTERPFPGAEALTKSLDSLKQSSLIPGFVVAIIDTNGARYTRGFGYASLRDSTAFTDSTVHGLASVSKTFVGLSVLQLVEQGKLALDDPINKYLPFPILHPKFPDQPIRVRHLVTHTASLLDDAFVPYYIGEADIGLVEDDSLYNRLPAYLQPNLAYYRMGKRINLEQYVRNYAQRGGRWYSDSTFLPIPPGSHFQYANLGAGIAGLIVEQVSGMSFASYTQRYIFEPLGMHQTGWDIRKFKTSQRSRVYAYNDETKPTGVVEHPWYYMTNLAASALHSNARDMSLYLAEMIRGYQGHGRLLKPENYQLLFRMQPAVEGFHRSDSANFSGQYGVAINWAVSAAGIRHHAGGNTGVYAMVYFDPKTGTGAVLFCNLRDPGFGDILETVRRFETAWDTETRIGK